MNRSNWFEDDREISLTMQSTLDRIRFRSKYGGRAYLNLWYSVRSLI